jgi:hypothetical protein
MIDNDDGLIEFPRQRTETSHELVIQEVPSACLPGQKARHRINCQPFQSVQLPFDVACLIYVFWVPPEEDEDAEPNEDSENDAEGMLFVAADPETIPDEAQPLACSYTCEGMKQNQVNLDGSSMGPFELRLERRRPFPTEGGMHPDRRCMLADLVFSVPNPPEAFRYRNRCPSPLQERCEDIGGCEFSRIFQCPQVMGYFRPMNKSCYRTEAQAAQE